MAKTRRAYTGASVSTTTSSAIAASGTTSFTVTAATNWPYGSDPFYVVLSPGTASEEKVLVTRANTGDTTINIASDAVRGLDGTSAVSHDSGATVYPVFTAVDADEANELAAMWESKGDLVSHGSSTFARLAVGTDDYVLMADSSAGSGLAWGLVDTANIATDAVTNVKMAANSVDTAELVANAVTEAKLDSAVVNKLLPAGTIAATIKSSADTGWLLLNGATVASADSTYPALWAVAPASWKSGSSLVLPDMANTMLFGQGTTTLGASGGSNTKTIATTNLPSHSHTINHGHANDIQANQSSHTHTITVTVNNNTTDLVYRGPDYTSVDYIAPYNASGGYADGLEGLGTYVSGGVSPGMAVGYITDHGHTASATASSTDPTISMSGGVTNHTGSSGSTGSGTALDVINAHLAINFQIKAH